MARLSMARKKRFLDLIPERLCDGSPPPPANLTFRPFGDKSPCAVGRIRLSEPSLQQASGNR